MIEVQQDSLSINYFYIVYFLYILFCITQFSKHVGDDNFVWIITVDSSL